MPKTVLLTGGTGIIGHEITNQLHKKGYHVRYLTTGNASKDTQVKKFHWNPDADNADPAAIHGVDYVINLAGASIANRWTTKNKREIFDSRVNSSRTLFKLLNTEVHNVKAVISASAVGIYPSDFEKCYTEEDNLGDNFLANVCRAWEDETKKYAQLNIREVRMRIGFVLSKKGGALEQLAKPVKYYVGAPVGNGKQWVPWIHIEDVAAMFIYAMENKHLNGPYNAVGPKSVTNKKLTKRIAKVLKMPLWMPKVPGFALKILLGEMAMLALMSTKVSSKKIEDAGYEFKYDELEIALQDLLK